MQIDDPHVLSSKFEVRDGMQTLRVFTNLSLRDDDNGRLSPEAERLIERAHDAIGRFHPSIKRIDFIRIAATA